MLLGVLALVGAGLLSLLIPWMRHWRELSALNARQSLEDEAIFSRYYAELGLSRSAVREIWCEIAQALDVPAAKMRPEDRFGCELGAHWIISDRLDTLAAKARQRARALGLDVELEKVETVDEYVRRFASN